MVVRNDNFYLNNNYIQQQFTQSSNTAALTNIHSLINSLTNSHPHTHTPIHNYRDSNTYTLTHIRIPVQLWGSFCVHIVCKLVEWICIPLHAWLCTQTVQILSSSHCVVREMDDVSWIVIIEKWRVHFGSSWSKQFNIVSPLCELREMIGVSSICVLYKEYIYIRNKEFNFFISLWVGRKY